MTLIFLKPHAVNCGGSVVISQVFRCLSVHGDKTTYSNLIICPRAVTSVHPAECAQCVTDVDQTPEMVSALTSPS